MMTHMISMLMLGCCYAWVTIADDGDDVDDEDKDGDDFDGDDFDNDVGLV